MKKLIILFLLLVPLTIKADDMWFKTSQLAIKISGEWSDWIPVVVKIKVTEDKVTIYSDEVQIYKIKHEIEAPHDYRGEQIAYRVIDHEGDWGNLRFRKQNNGQLQLYIDFSNISWVYDINRIY